LLEFGWCGFAPGTCRKTIEADGADGYSDEAQRGVADGGGHSADLAVPSFSEGEFEPGFGDAFADSDGWVSRSNVGLWSEDSRFRGAGSVVPDVDSFAE
jgi:hypothetical protein